MLTFPDDARINIPAGMKLRGNCAVAVRIANGESISGMKRWYGERIHHYRVSSLSALEGRVLEELRGERVWLKVSADDLPIVAELAGLLRRTNAVIGIEPTRDLVKKINFLAGFDLPVSIDVRADVEDGAALERAVDYYLHNPLLKVPIEPFHSLLGALGFGSRLFLADFGAEQIGRDFYIGEDQSISLSEWWLGAGYSFGSLHHTWVQITESAAFRRIDGLKKDLFLSGSDCAFCPDFSFCGGFFRTADGEYLCEPWKAGFARLREEFQRSRELMREYQEGSTP
jgi:hypothetical protein